MIPFNKPYITGKEVSYIYDDQLVDFFNLPVLGAILSSQQATLSI